MKAPTSYAILSELTSTKELTIAEVRPHCDSLTAFQRLLSYYGTRAPHFFLDSALRASSLSRYSLLGFQPFLILKSKGNRITVIDTSGVQEKKGNPFEVLRFYLQAFRGEDAGAISPALDLSKGLTALPSSMIDLPGICWAGGVVGYLSYDLCHFLERLPKNTLDDLGFPDMCFGFYTKFVVYDHKEDRCFIVGRDLEEDIRELVSLLSTQNKGRKGSIKGLRTAKDEVARFIVPNKSGFINPTPAEKGYKLRCNFTKREYIEAIRRAKEYIARGDIYQVNLSQRFQADTRLTPHALYLRLRAINPAPFSAYLQFGDNVIISASPERFLKVKEGRVQTYPVKGTRPRGKDPASDERLMVELLSSAKDSAELTMIVDLERNDLGKVSKYGSVKVVDKKRLESHPTVFHLVATVESELYPQYDLVDLLKATFPGGSVTGAPKIRAMEVIDELEPTSRSVYTGAIGYIGFDGSMDLAMAIRTFLVKGSTAFFQAGGGIVADSQPGEEYQETLFKSRALMEALCE